METLPKIGKATMSKPTLTFVKMMGCGPCNNFFGNPDPEKSQWAQLVKDKELAKIVEFSLAEWGFDRQTGSQFKKPTHLGFVNYGPAFVLVDSGNKEVHLEYDKNSPKTAAGIKKWVLENHKKLKGSVASKPATQPVAKPVVQPTGQPSRQHRVTPQGKQVPAKATPQVQTPKTGAPRSFVSDEKLPPQLRSRNNVRNEVVPPVTHTVPPPQLHIQPVQTAQVQAPQVQNKPAPGLRIVPRNTRQIGRRR